MYVLLLLSTWKVSIILGQSVNRFIKRFQMLSLENLFWITNILPEKLFFLNTLRKYAVVITRFIVWTLSSRQARRICKYRWWILWNSALSALKSCELNVFLVSQVLNHYWAGLSDSQAPNYCSSKLLMQVLQILQLCSGLVLLWLR